MNASDRLPTLYRLMSDLDAFSGGLLPRHGLRPYQLAPARAILESIDRRRGDQFAIVFSRQAGKDELLVQLLAFLLVQRAHEGGSVVVAAPTYAPQAVITRDRLRARLLANPLTAPDTHSAGNAVRFGRAQVTFASAAPVANARGLTADLLLVANEAQDIAPETWDAVFDPMAASTNATTVYMGTVWSDSTLLARQMRFLRELEARDGHRRVWLVPWNVVAEEVPAYGERVRSRIAQLGEDHPFVRTEYRLLELDGNGGLFPADRIARMRGDHARLDRARPGHRYALLIDVGGEEEAALAGEVALSPDGRRDSTALTVVEIDPDSRADGLPVYRVVDRRLWTGVRHAVLHGDLVRLARETWRARWVVVDATGIGAGLASFLASSLGAGRGGHPPVHVEPFVFSASSKSRLGWDFLGLVDSGRYREYAVPHSRTAADPFDPATPAGGHTRPDGRWSSPTGQSLVSVQADAVTAEFYRQLRATTYEVRNGPGNLLRWSVPARDGHDDLVVSAALCAALDQLDHRPRIARGT